MPSSFTWVDFAEDDRKKMMDVVHLFGEQETVDELGIGAIRDAFADYFFPGTSTIQTRARYMLFIPWLYRTLENERVLKKDIGKKARALEVKLIASLLAGDPKGNGIIGKDAREKLQRLPSNVYWVGMATWGIRKFGGTQPQYHDSLDSFYAGLKLMEKADEEELVPEHRLANWDSQIPPKPDGLLDSTNLALTWDEADYLRSKISKELEGTLLDLMVRDPDYAEADWLWSTPTAVGCEDPTLQSVITHARNFSDAIYMASLLYNLLLARKRAHADWIAAYETALTQHIKDVGTRWSELQTWNRARAAFWENPALSGKQVRILPRTRAFVDNFLDLLFSVPLEDLMKNKNVLRLIEDRELRLKGPGRARLQNQRALERWQGASGAYQLSYRWPNTRTLLRDIREGLSKEND